jgi:hypothetical protein
VTAAEQPPAQDRGAAPFARREAGWLAALAAVSLVASGALAAFADVLDVPSSAADSFSRSALGHHAFVELLGALGRPVVVSRSRTADKAPGATVVIAEPLLGPAELDERSRELLRGMLAAADRVLLVLPKRVGFSDRLRPRWIGGALPVPEQLAQEVLAAAGLDARVVRPQGSAGGWRGELPPPDVAEPQLVASASLAPLVSTGEGMLVGERLEGGRRLVVLADPDVLETHGLGRGRNAELAVALLDRLDPGGGAVVVDETLHGHELQPSIARELLRWPLVLATLQAALALALLAWAALARFGRPRPAPPPLGPGKEVLVENAAELLRHGGHVAPCVAAYWRSAKEQIARALRPPGERSADLEASFAAVAAARGRTARVAELERRVASLAGRRRAEEEALRTALDIHAFREEMTDGARADP